MVAEFSGYAALDEDIDQFSEVIANISSVDWFCRAGSNVSEQDRTLVDGYFDELDLKPSSILQAQDLCEVEDRIRNRYDPRWLEAETTAYDKLLQLVKGSQHAIDIEYLTKSITNKISSEVLELAEKRLKNSNKYLNRVAAGSATETCYRYALEAMLSSGNSRCFTMKFDIFRLGKWPLCLSEGVYILY